MNPGDYIRSAGLALKSGNNRAAEYSLEGGEAEAAAVDGASSITTVAESGESVPGNNAPRYHHDRRVLA